MFASEWLLVEDWRARHALSPPRHMSSQVGVRVWVRVRRRFVGRRLPVNLHFAAIFIFTAAQASSSHVRQSGPFPPVHSFIHFLGNLSRAINGLSLSRPIKALLILELSWIIFDHLRSYLGPQASLRPIRPKPIDRSSDWDITSSNLYELSSL